MLSIAPETDTASLEWYGMECLMRWNSGILAGGTSSRQGGASCPVQPFTKQTLFSDPRFRLPQWYACRHSSSSSFLLRTFPVLIVATCYLLPLQPSQADIRRKNAQFMNKAQLGRNPVKPPRVARGSKTAVAGWVLGGLLFLLLGGSK
jgi:hypothetical protein